MANQDGAVKRDLRTDYVNLSVLRTDYILGPALNGTGPGMVGDVLEELLAVCLGAAGQHAMSIRDGDGPSIPIVPANAPPGVYMLHVGARAKNATTPGWKVTTGLSVVVLAVGSFQAFP